MFQQIFIFATLLASSTIMARYINPQCQPIGENMCKDLDQNYVQTSFPNFMNHSSADVAERELSQYSDIIESGCSGVLQMFLCSLYIPICNPRVGKRIPPCKSLCQQARSGCEPLLNSAHIRWPHSMNCDRFPEENSGELCVSPDPRQPAPKTPIDEVEANRIPSKRTSSNKGKYLSRLLIDLKSILIYNNFKTMKPNQIFNPFYFFLFSDRIPSIAKKDLKPMEEVKLVCPTNKQILVRKTRHFPEKNTECCPVDSLAEISKRCNGKQNCDVILDKNVIGAGCVATMKKTSVKYKCVSLEHSVKYHRSIGCRKTDKNGIL